MVVVMIWGGGCGGLVKFVETKIIKKRKTIFIYNNNNNNLLKSIKKTIEVI